MNKNSLYYKHSGKFTFWGILLCLGVITIYSLIVGYIYVVLTHYNPFAFINFLATIGYGFITLILINLCISIGKIRSKKIFLILGIVAGFLSLHIQWATWMSFMQPDKDDIEEAINDAISSDPMMRFLPDSLINEVLNFDSLTNSYIDESHSKWEMIANPKILWDEIVEMSEYRGFSLGGKRSLVRSLATGEPRGLPISGVFIWIIWIIEALIIFGIPLIGTGTSEPFCEVSNTWASLIPLPLCFAPIESKNNFISSLENKDYEVFKSLEIGFRAGNHTDISFHCCEGASQYIMTVKDIEVKLDKKGEKSATENVIVDKLIIDEITAKRLINSANRLATVLSEREQLNTNKEEE